MAAETSAAEKPAAETPNAALRDHLVAALLSSQAEVDVAAYRLRPTELSRIYTEVCQENPALFHVAPRLSYSVTSGGTVAVLYPTYTIAGNALREARAFYRDTMAGILADMEELLPAPREAEIALYLHDRLADQYDYDLGSATGPAGGNADAYTFFRDGRGVCQAYALAYLALARAAGLEADFVSSPAMDHAWVHIRVDGAWYHVDVTRDDPIPAPGGSPMVTHTRVLCSDAALETLGYRDWFCVGGHACTDTRYDGLFSDVREVLRPLSLAHRRVWGAMTAEGLRMVELSPTPIRLPLGDINADGGVTPADLLCLYDPTVPASWRVWMRERLTE